VRQVLNSPATTHMPFWSLNPYVGCEFGCSYCYARKTHEWVMERAHGGADAQAEAAEPGAGAPVGPSAHAAFEQSILVKQDAAEVLLRTLAPARLGRYSLVIGTATDPYQPAERKFGLTRRVLEALTRHRGLSIGLITKSPLVARDLDLLQVLAGRHDLSVNISLASLDAGLLRRLEARSPAPHARLRALQALTGAGIHAGLLIAPVLPGITDGWAHLAALLEAAKEAGARYVIGVALRLGPAARTGFLPVLEREFPELVPRYRRRYGAGPNAGRDYEAALTRRLRALQQAFGFPLQEGMRRQRQLEGR
jgi:DNA repair photolyase